VKPKITPANCSSGPGGWFAVWNNFNGNINEYCWGGGGFVDPNLSGVYDILTGNNWGHIQYANQARFYFSYYQEYTPSFVTLIGIWLYE